MSKLLLGCSGIDARGTSFRRSMQIECEQVIIEVRRACELPVKHSQVRCERSLTKGLTDHYLKMNRTWRPTPRWRDPVWSKYSSFGAWRVVSPQPLSSWPILDQNRNKLTAARAANAIITAGFPNACQNPCP